MTTTKTEWTEAELLASHPFAEPLVVRGVRCHGGFDENGSYVSPRTLNRVPAISAWKKARERAFGTPLLDIALSSWPGAYPNIDQARYLIGEGVREPIVSILTRVGTVEGFGSYLRYTPVPDVQACFEEDLHGTTTEHLAKGLIEAHARDEAGHGDEGGHKQMWFAARDVAFENPPTEDQTEAMLKRMGISYGGPASASPGQARPNPLEGVRFSDVDPDLLMLVARMVRLLLIEISAFHTFAWAEELLSDSGLVAGEGEAARLVSYIRTDETPHVEYLKTALSEMRDRTFRGEHGSRYPGTEVVGVIWDRARSESLGPGRQATLDLTLGEVEHALESRRQGADILEEFHALGSTRPGPDGTWIDAA